jgi:hypothetical protein
LFFAFLWLKSTRFWLFLINLMTGMEKTLKSLMFWKFIEHFVYFSNKSSLIFYKDVSALFMLSELQPCVISIRLKFAQRKQSRYVSRWEILLIFLPKSQKKFVEFWNHYIFIISYIYWLTHICNYFSKKFCW